MRTGPNTHKGMTPLSTQNLKTLCLWVFFFICCLTFSFLPNVGLRLTLEYPTISPSSESLSSILMHSPSSHICTLSESPSSLWVHSPSSRSIFKHEYLNHKQPSLVPPFTHLNGTHLPETSCWENSRGKHSGDKQE